jgi:hypothetical protein
LTVLFQKRYLVSAKQGGLLGSSHSVNRSPTNEKSLSVMKHIVDRSEAIQDVYKDCQRRSRVVDGRDEYVATWLLQGRAGSEGK